MNVFDRQDKWLMRLCFGIALVLLLSIVRHFV
ncbi:hypothetical protein PAECIP111802_00227 [Paenibacillus allorhizosphaerae]|uniref:Uncharacterized protein n=1 Tax=Paenibacillus allorhizosphaerae TaxID=2849866 RepID=A0ABM8VAA4_9BACL|nr:hypothetical protein PAECIP111802_00227 [Paenibacillus allorhizosphaerae]